MTSVNISQNQAYNLGLNQRMQWYGGQMGLTFNNGRNYSNSSNSTFNPSYNSSLRVNYTQPILANFKIDNQRNALRTTVIQRQMSDVALQSTIENTKSNVRTAYWALRQAIERIEIQRLSLLLAQQVVADNKIKVEIGTMAPIDQTTAEVQEAQSEQALLNAQVQWTTAELVLKRLIVGGPDDELYRSTLNPTTSPGFELQSVDIAAAIQNATAQRTDIVQQRQNLDVSNLNLEVSKDATKPQLDLTGSYQLAGTGGLSKDQTGNYFDALFALGTLNTPTWTVGLNFNYPIGMAAARASLRARRDPARTRRSRGSRSPSCRSRPRSPTPGWRCRTPGCSSRPRRSRARPRRRTPPPSRRASTSACRTRTTSPRRSTT